MAHYQPIAAFLAKDNNALKRKNIEIEETNELLVKRVKFLEDQYDADQETIMGLNIQNDVAQHTVDLYQRENNALEQEREDLSIQVSRMRRQIIELNASNRILRDNNPRTAVQRQGLRTRRTLPTSFLAQLQDDMDDIPHPSGRIPLTPPSPISDLEE